VIDSRQWFGRPAGDWCSAELLLAHGAAIVAEKRAKVFSQLGYTVSAGMLLQPMLESSSCGWCTPLLQNFWLNDGAAESFHSSHCAEKTLGHIALNQLSIASMNW
jgi:hypothetical protein